MTNANIDTTLIEIAATVYDEACALVGPGPEAEALAHAAFSSLLRGARVPRRAARPTTHRTRASRIGLRRAAA